MRPGSPLLEPLTAADWPAAAHIYEAGIATGNATFEAAAPSWEEWSGKRAGCPAMLARGEDGEMLGWAALAPVSARAVYRGVGSVSIYVAGGHTRRGIGRALLEGLAETAESAGFWAIEAGIFPENEASVALHRRCGFRLVGVRERIGQMPDGRWRDVLLFERRSTVIGVD
ncbi:MAG TPA: GNAT family N-acetyltransferase [Solirubrobacteraceae bacterium]|jgi:phosphinothricin acetyltransferase|nr:GNAT family N-acetyltransferase [Solirubrobacteraceae bacterium]